MKGTWIVYQNHIALKCNDEVLHPSASELFEIISKKKESIVPDIEYESVLESFPDTHFSKVGSDVTCLLYSKDNLIFLELFCNRKGKKVYIDLIEGTIVDQCISDSEWFYVTGCIEALEEIFYKVNIKNTGVITVSQYIELLRNTDDFGRNCLINNVESSAIDKKIDGDANIPYGLNAKLYKYQKIGYNWMRYMLNENSGCILGDEMGLGKTLQIITLMLYYKHEKKTPILVIAPVSLLQNWQRECERFAPSIKTLIHHGSRRSGRYKTLEENDVVIISYNTAVSDSSILKMINWQLVVLDEAQNIKNPGSDRTKFVKMIPRNASIAVTGTPFENHVSDIWSLADFVIPGLLGTQTEYNNYISDDIEGADKVQPLLTPIMIRRMVSDVATDLPEKIVIPQAIEMSEIESLKYEELRKDASGAGLSGGIGIAILQKMRMFCTHPYLCCDYQTFNPIKESLKYQRLCEILDEIFELDEKVIIFTSYQEMFNIFEKDLSVRYNIPIFTINGKTKVENRQTIVDRFNECEGTALIILNPRAAGVGLNITSANHVIHYNLEWNPALEDQASARSYRRGQQKTVFVYRLYYINTVEQVVNERLERKREIAKTAIVGTDGSIENRNDILNALNISPIKETETC